LFEHCPGLLAVSVLANSITTISLPRSDHLRRRLFADFFPPEKTDVTLTTKKNRLTKPSAVNATSVADNDWRYPTILDHNIWPFDSVSI
jgi:hypothetical protein